MAVVVTGSRASGRAAGDSDVDLFVYADEPALDLRSSVAREMADTTVAVLIDVDPFGSGDVWRERVTRAWFDIVFWSPQWAEEQLDRMLLRHEPSTGYTTAFWRTIASARPLYERDGWHGTLQQRARRPYPDELVTAIVEHNVPWLRDHPFSFRNQVAKAIDRNDQVSVNHRVAAWLASYFDVVFALNRVLHPGEKRMLEVAGEECSAVPDRMSEHVAALLAGPTDLPRHLDAMTDRLLVLVEKL